MRNLLKTIKFFFIHGWQFRSVRYWDSAYLYKGLSILLENYEKEFKTIPNDWQFKNHKNCIKDMIIAKNLAKRLETRDYKTLYSEKSLDYINNWWDTCVEKRQGKYVTLEFSKFNKGLDWSKKDHDAAEALIQLDKDLLFKILSKRADKWWW